ncbi:hypothetical protein LIER_44027 [Lithospermum erythrorhizon]|uniref:Uncharacterized protein n=1 Tax=Lithospermum erythrorhizon TaxID=34254 RepID=A0AAV3RR51_LITER
MAEDFKKGQSQLNLSDNDILYKVLEGINDTLESLGRNVNQFLPLSTFNAEPLSTPSFFRTSSDRHRSSTTLSCNFSFPTELLTAAPIGSQLSGKDANSINACNSSSKLTSTVDN